MIREYMRSFSLNSEVRDTARRNIQPRQREAEIVYIHQVPGFWYTNPVFFASTIDSLVEGCFGV